MKKNIFAEVLEKIGGASFVERFARKHPAQFLQLAKTELTSQPPHVAPSETELRAVIERSLLGAVGALYSKADNGSSGVRDAAAAHDAASKPTTVGTLSDNSNRGIIDTPGHDIAKTLAAQRQLEESKSKLDERKREPAEEARARAMAPLMPKPINQQPTTTELFLQWQGRARPTWSPPYGW